MNTKTFEADMEAYISQQLGVKASTRLDRLINVANNDLYFGPSMTRNGFVSVCRKISAILSDAELPSYYDNFTGEFFDTLPEGEEVDGEWIEPYLEETYELSRREWLTAICGRELSVYIDGF